MTDSTTPVTDERARPDSNRRHPERLAEPLREVGLLQLAYDVSRGRVPLEVAKRMSATAATIKRGSEKRRASEGADSS